MTQVQEESLQRRCPRCGGPMVKLPGSSFYWHADYTHPRCDITNIVDFPADEKTAPVSSSRSALPLPTDNDKDKDKGKEKRPKK
jgi:ssDNA-binding Zn-finger/Zn-ribbon topoisomerase 1